MQWPPEAEAVHGGQYWAVFLAVARSDSDQSKLASAQSSAEALGYQAGNGDVACTQGAVETLGLDPDRSYMATSIFFATEQAARTFVDLYQPGVVGTAQITAYCLD